MYTHTQQDFFLSHTCRDPLPFLLSPLDLRWVILTKADADERLGHPGGIYPLVYNIMMLNDRQSMPAHTQSNFFSLTYVETSSSETSCLEPDKHMGHLG